MLLSIWGMAQQDAHYTQFMSNKLVINPAYAGSREALSLTALYRHQWQGFEGAPRTGTFSFNAPFLKNNSGIGMSVIYDKLGLSEAWFIDLSYAYKLKLNDKNTLNIGLLGRVEYIGTRWDRADPLNPGDINIPLTQPNRFLPDFGVGVYYYHENFYAGFSIPHVLKNGLYISQDIDPNAGQYYENKMHYYLMGGGVMKLGSSVKFTPSILIKYQPESPFDVDLNASVLMMDAVWFGVTYRLGDALGGILQYQFNQQFKVGLAYDYHLSELKRHQPGSWEIMADYIFKYDNERIKNIRYF